ncbi:MAG: hypothetical protein IPN95_18280 [Bacteroidetes bacterium]|nr:hypothetical protein [Bacteroidota bacterium]
MLFNLLGPNFGILSFWRYHYADGLDFISATQGWVVGNDGVILTTSDAGQTWVQQNSGTTSHLTSVSFTNVSVGIAVGENGKVVRTTDGGTNWMQVSSGVSHASTVFKSPQEIGPTT